MTYCCTAVYGYLRVHTDTSADKNEAPRRHVLARHTVQNWHDMNQKRALEKVVVQHHEWLSPTSSTCLELLKLCTDLASARGSAISVNDNFLLCKWGRQRARQPLQYLLKLYIGSWLRRARSTSGSQYLHLSNGGFAVVNQRTITYLRSQAACTDKKHKHLLQTTVAQIQSSAATAGGQKVEEQIN